MKIIVFGGAGFVGSHVADELSLRGHKVTVVDNKKPKFKLKNYKFAKGNILNIKSLKKSIKNADVVYNFAAISDIGEAYSRPVQTVITNILGNVNILELCKKYKVKRYVFASSIYVYSQQGGFYRTSKQSAELFIEEYNRTHRLPYTILRYGSMYGPRTDLKNGLYKIVYDALSKKRAIYRGTKRAVRSYIHVKDAAKISVDILNKKYANKNILVTGKEGIKIEKLLSILSKILNIRSRAKFLNQTQKGHYDVSPYTYKPKATKKLFPKKSVNLKLGLIELVKEIKKNK